MLDEITIMAVAFKDPVIDGDDLKRSTVTFRKGI